jgi:hypothetical protein
MMENKTPTIKIARKKAAGRKSAAPLPFILFPVSTLILSPLVQHLPRAGRRQNRSR